MDASMREPSPRSYLFVPGNRPDRFDKAVSSTADVVICDVEDAVPPDEKAQSRDNVLEWLKKGASICVRVNGWNTPWFMDDVLAFASHPGVSAIMLPKAETANQISELQAHCHPSMKILPIIETARGFDALGAISSAMGVARIVFGTVDFQLDLGIDGDDLELLMFRSQIVLASRLAGIESPVDGVTTRIGDPDLVEANARRGKRLGFGAMLCIHPNQVAPVHRGYAYTDQEEAWALRVLAATQASAGAAVAVDGKMVDLPVILKAQRIAIACGHARGDVIQGPRSS
jgi:citrate lyase subunit beta/citryl-CoA lyase